METLFAAPERQYNNSSQETGTLLLSDWVDVATVGSITIRFDIVEIQSGSVSFSLSWRNGAVQKAAFTRVWTIPGQYQIGINRGDIDDTTMVSASLVVNGRARLSFAVYSIAKGEDVLPWL